MHIRSIFSTRWLLTLASVCACIYVGAFAAHASAATPTAPSVSTAAPTAITNGGATLNASINPNGEATNVYVQYGLTDTYGQTTASTPLVGGSTPTAVSLTLTGLTAGSHYDYRFVAVNTDGTSTGGNHAFVTADVPLAITETATPSSVALGDAFVISGVVTGTLNAGAQVQLQSNPYPYTAGFTDIGNPEVAFANGSFTFNVIDLSVSTEYRVVAGAETSPVVVVTSPVAVSLKAKSEGSFFRPLVRFTGAIKPAQPNAEVAIERWNGSSWVVVGGTNAGNGLGVTAGTLGSEVHFGVTLRIHRSGDFRALVLPVEGGHTNGYSPAVFVRVR